MVDNIDITVVIQGAVQTFKGRLQDPEITKQCITSIREYLPNALIILSTWENQNLDNLDVDELVINQDPGPNITQFNKDGTPHYHNFYRQIVFSREGLKRVKTKYAIKLRSDNFLTGSYFKQTQQAFPKRQKEYSYFTERVVFNTNYFRQYAEGKRVILHPCNFFHFGLTSDLLKIWDLPIFEDRVYQTSKAGQVQSYSSPMQNKCIAMCG